MIKKIIFPIALLSVGYFIFYFLTNYERKVLDMNQKIEQKSTHRNSDILIKPDTNTVDKSNQKKKIPPQKKQKVSGVEQTDSINFEKKRQSSRIYTWKELKIKPILTPEGVFYTFSGFDISDNKITITGIFNEENMLKIIDKKHITSIHLDAIPLDVLQHENKIYVLTTKYLYIVENNKINHKINLNQKNILFSDKLLIFDDKFHILMSDGSEFSLNNNKLIQNRTLVGTNNQFIWIKKTGAKSFKIDAQPCDDICQSIQLDGEIGSITISGGKIYDIYCCIDEKISNNANSYRRIIRSSKQQFIKDLITLPSDTYTYIKNDYKIHGDTIYYLKVDDKGFSIHQKEL